jgi:teichuronic acid biosynthesis glycosyltransferase TuaG
MEIDLISIICTVKNGENTILNTINSVINQTYKKWEFIIVDDGSTDNTINIIKKIKDERIRVIPTEGIGRAKALNLAIDNSSGKYICNIDADDLMHPEKTDLEYRIMKENPDLFLVSTETQLIYNSELPVWEKSPSMETCIKEVNDSILIRNPINHSSIMMVKGVVQELGGYDINLKSQLDYDLWLRSFMANKKLCIISQKLTAKRIHSNQSFENKRRLVYLYNNAKLLMKYNLKYKKKKYRIVIPPILFLFGLLPFKARRMLKKV